MNTLLLDMPATAARSQQLVAASERATHDPFREIDWDTPIDDSAFHLPPELLALYGTEPWNAMSQAERIAYSRHETAAMFGAGIWFENALMQIVLSHLIEIDVQDPMHRYLLTEVADECRHSMMFGEYIRRAGTPSYGPTREVTIEPGKGGRAMSYLAILAIEELINHPVIPDSQAIPEGHHVDTPGGVPHKDHSTDDHHADGHKHDAKGNDIPEGYHVDEPGGKPHKH